MLRIFLSLIFASLESMYVTPDISGVEINFRGAVAQPLGVRITIRGAAAEIRGAAWRITVAHQEENIWCSDSLLSGS